MPSWPPNEEANNASQRIVNLPGCQTLKAAIGSGLNMMRCGSPMPLFQQEQLRYNPTGEWIFPSLLDTSALPGRPQSRWFLYYSPHDAPGGICLAYADHLAGPWREHDSNPIVSRVWEPYYRVGHVASPHALWVPEERKVFLWFHGENHETRYATSTDGIHFVYQGVALSTHDFDNTVECSYGRVFRHTMPSVGNRYVMMLEGYDGEHCKIIRAWSSDARTWTSQRSAYLVAPAELGGHGGSSWLIRDGQCLSVVYTASRFVGQAGHDVPGDFCAVPVSEDLEPTGPHRLVYSANAGYPDFGRADDLIVVRDENDAAFVFYTAGRRLEGRLFAMPLTAFSLT